MELVSENILLNKGSRGTLCSAHIADLHFGVMNPKTQYEILEEQFINKLLPLPLDFVCIEGDIFEHKAMANSDMIMYGIRFVDTLIQKVIIPKRATLVLILGTNGHDADQYKLFHHYINNPEIDIRIVENVRYEYIKGAKYLCIPEVPSVDDILYKKLLFESGVYDGVMMHGTLDAAGFAASTNCKLFNIEDFALCRGPIISGHIHNGGCFNKYFYYCGSPYSWSFADKPDKGFLICLHNLDTGAHYMYKEIIKSFKYETINLDTLIDADPKQIIDYIDKLKKERDIDYIRVEFDKNVSDDTKYMIDSFYKNNNNVKLKYNFTKDQKYVEQKLKQDEELEQYSYIFDNSLSEYDKLARYINDSMGYVYVKAEEIKRLVEEPF